MQLKKTLDDLYHSYQSEFLSSPDCFFSKRRDPVLFPHRYRSFHDREAAAFLAATFAYGNVTSLCAFVDRLLGLLGSSPHAFLQQGPAVIDQLKKERPYYRLQKTQQIVDLLKALSRVYAEYGSLYGLFLMSYDQNSTMKVAASAFVRQIHQLSPGSSLKFLIPDPNGGSPCKRLNLFFRWMVRKDAIDFGLWKEVKTSGLIMPLDTHIGRIAFRLGWIDTPSLSWQKAETVTSVLRRFNQEDPTKYDFSLCHESIQRSRWLKEKLYD